MTRLIDADALIEDLEYDVELDARSLDDTDLSLGMHRELVQFDKDCKQNAIDMLKKASAVDAEPVRHGQWDYVTVVDDGFWRCSICGTPSEAIGAKKLYKYCPFCGAKMRDENGNSE